jgi:ATP-dependent protease ClpP protease subunit
MMKKPWKFIAAGRGALTIELLEQIGEDLFSDAGTTAKSFSEELAAAGPGITSIKLRISSPGGSVWDGLAIYDQLLRHPARVTAEVMFAASIASVIAMAADKISVTPTSVMMIHLPHTLVAGDANDLRKMASTLDTVTQAMIKGYQRHTPKSAKAIEELMSQETWYNASEAVENGFADEVFDPDEEDKGAGLAAAFAAPIFARFHPPARVAQIAARYAGDDDERRRRLRLRTLELHDMWEDEHRREAMATHAQQLSNLRAVPEPSEDLQRRRILARHDRELRAWRLDELAARGGGDVEEGRRRIMAERAKERAAWEPVMLGGGYLVPINSSMETNFARRASEGATWV